MLLPVCIHSLQGGKRVERREKEGKSRKAEDTEEKYSCKFLGVGGSESHKVCLSGCSIQSKMSANRDLMLQQRVCRGARGM